MYDQSRRPLFSIVVPAYCAERYIDRSIGCVLAQTVDDWELVVVDDASTDSTAEVADRYAKRDARIRVVRHEANRGAAEARNTGMDVARGLYLWMPDVDDVYSPQTLERVAVALSENPAQVTCFGINEVYLDDRGEASFEHPVPLDDRRINTAEELRPLILPMERKSSYGYVHTKVYDLDYVRSTGVRFQHMTVNEDLEFNVGVFQGITSLNTLSDVLYRYERRSNDSLTSSFIADYYELHYHRVKILRDQQESWGLLDGESKAVLGGLFARYILSAVERTFDERANMDDASRRAWLDEVFASELFNELIPHASGDSAILKASLLPIQAKSAPALIAFGGVIHFVRSHSLWLYTAAKQKR